MSRAPLLECRGLRRIPWIDGFDLALEAGEIVMLAGPSGSGKTLLLRTIADLDPADGGEVRLEGRERASIRPCDWRAQVTYLHQTAVRLPGSVGENLERITRLGAQQARRTNGIGADRVGLEARVPVERLSGGEMQRLALYRALELDPRVLLLDEATSALDEASARQSEDAVRRWVARGRAVLWVSHDTALGSRLEARTVTLR